MQDTPSLSIHAYIVGIDSVHVPFKSYTESFLLLLLFNWLNFKARQSNCCAQEQFQWRDSTLQMHLGCPQRLEGGKGEWNPTTIMVTALLSFVTMHDYGYCVA